MKKIFFETLKHKLGHYLLVILCGILMVSTIYVSYAFSDSIERIINGQNSGIVEEMYTFINFQETYYLLFTINEQISNFAQTYPTNLKASSNEALLFMRRYRFANCSCFSCCFKDAYPSSNVQ